jgi:hypothetical protein
MASPRLRWLTGASRHWRTANDGGLGTVALVDGGDLLRADGGRWGLGGGAARAGQGGVGALEAGARVGAASRARPGAGPRGALGGGQRRRSSGRGGSAARRAGGGLGGRG